jgi:hypothetical protein
MPRNKYGAKTTVVDGIRFHSKRESERYSELKLLQRAGEIRDLTMQPKFPIVVNNEKICVYIADFFYLAGDKRVVEDVKGAKTALYSIKKKLVEALYDFKITEIR